ncbi:MAG TPA: hypothetical protein VNG33_03780 [Polyangiaceae bacterium]|nr:hypothetical protein [Polyangiaceae bacterium]
MPEEPVAAADPHHVEPRQALSALRAFAAQWWPLVVGVFALAGGYYDIKSDLKLQAKEISDLKAWIKNPGQFPGSRGAQSAPIASVSPTGTIPSIASAAPTALDPDPQAAPPPSARGLKGFPSSVPPTSPPECVSSKVFKKMPCEQAAKNTCRGLTSFAPERYRDIRLKAGVGEYMLVCDER